MPSVSQSVLEELRQYLTNQRLKMVLFQSKNKALIESQFTSPEKVTEENYIQLVSKIKRELPTSHLYTLISSKGTNLLEHITGPFLADCKEEVLETISSGQQQHLFLHRSDTSAHYDLIQSRNVNRPSAGYIFFAFNTDFISQLLSKYQLPYQQLFLVRKDKKGLIEISSQSMKTTVKAQYLDQETLAAFEHSIDIPETRWKLAIRLDPKAKTKLFQTALWQALFTWSLVTLLLYLSFFLIKRNLESKYHSQERLKNSQKITGTIINSVNEAVFSIDKSHIITFANTRAKEMLTISNNIIEGARFSDVCSLYYLQDRDKLKLEDMISAYEKNELPRYSNLRLQLSEGNDIPVAVKLAPIYNQAIERDGYTITIEDLSTAIELSKRVVFHESRDSLTGLFNRRQLDKKLNSLILLNKREPATFRSAVILIDLDNFKLLNTVHGFDGGDEFLKRIAVLLQQTIPDSYCLSRLSADEFIVVFENINDRNLIDTCNKIKLAIRRFEFHWQDEILSTSVCLGVVRLDQNFTNIDAILSAADHASRLAKAKGTNFIQFYFTDDPEIRQRTQEVTQYADLKKAISDGRFVLYRQAIRTTDVNSKTNKYELLMRMQKLDGKLVSPAQVIPTAEKYGLMAKIDRWVLRHAFIHLGETPADKAHYSINISGKTLSERDIVRFTENLFEQYQVAPERINFEITETAAISYLDNALEFMQAMKSRGCSFSLDDFGTGLASFDYLRKLPIDFVKIDGVFVKELHQNPNDYAFVEAIHKLSTQMGIKTVAEFVENSIIFNILSEIGVDFVQGYYVHKPERWF